MENLINGSIVAYSVLLNLYQKSSLFIWAENASSQYSSYLTDTVTLFAALSAIAIPFAQQTVQWVSDKYKSPSMIQLIELSATVKPKDLNKKLLIYLCIVFAFKFFHSVITFNSSIVLIFNLYFFFNFFYLVFLVSKHFEHTYKVVNSAEWIYDYVDYNTLLKDSELFFSIKIRALSEFESYRVKNDPSHLDISDEFRNLGYNLTSDLNNINKAQFIEYINCVEFICRTFSDKIYSRKYVKAACFYSYLVTKAIKSKHSSDYTYLISNLRTLADEVESDLYVKYKPLSSGRVFTDSNWLGEWDIQVQDTLAEHFRQLIQLNVINKDSESLVSLFESVSNAINFTNEKNDFPYFVQSQNNIFFRLESARKLTEFIESEINEVDGVNNIIDKLEKFKSDIIIEIDSDLDVDIDGVFSELREELLKFRLRRIMDHQILNFISLSASIDPSVIISCREAKNPIGSDVFDIGYNLLPSSINEILTNLSQYNNFDRWNTFSIKNWSGYLLKGLAVLFVYELTERILTGRVKEISLVFLNQLNISELKSLFKSIDKFEQSISSVLLDSAIQELILFHSVSKTELIEVYSQIISDIKKQCEVTLKSKRSSSPISKKLKSEFIYGFLDESKKVLNDFPIFDRVLINSKVGAIYNLERPRESLLENTGVHYAYSGLGYIVKNHLIRVVNSLIINEKLSMSANDTLPIKNGRYIVVTKKAMGILKNSGFIFNKGMLTWPDEQFKCPFVISFVESERYTLVHDKEALIKVSLFNSVIPNVPVSIDMIDQGESIVWKIGINILPA